MLLQQSLEVVLLTKESVLAVASPDLDDRAGFQSGRNQERRLGSNNRLAEDGELVPGKKMSQH